MVPVRTLAVIVALTIVSSAVRTEAFLLDFSTVSDGPVPANSNVEGFGPELQTARSSRNEAGAFGDFTGGGRGIELQSLFSMGSENDGVSDSEFILSPLGSETLDASNNWVGVRFQVDTTTGVGVIGGIRENANHGGDDYGSVQVLSDGTMRALAANTLALGNYNANQWYDIAYDIDFPGGTTDVYVDGVNMGSVAHDAIHADANSIAFFAFRGIDQALCNCGTTERGAPQIRVDAVLTGSSLEEVTAIPEPASLGLLAVSGLLMLSRRRRA